MKKVLLLLTAMVCLATVKVHAAVPVMLEDTSILRISTAEERAAYLNKMMSRRLKMNSQETREVGKINAKYEQQVQDLFANSRGTEALISPEDSLLDNRNKKVGKSKKKEMSQLEKLSDSREKEMKKVLSKANYKEYDKHRLAIRTGMKKQMEYNKESRERAARQAIIDKARADSLEKVKAEQAKLQAAAPKNTTATKSSSAAAKKSASTTAAKPAATKPKTTSRTGVTTKKPAQTGVRTTTTRTTTARTGTGATAAKKTTGASSTTVKKKPVKKSFQK